MEHQTIWLAPWCAECERKECGDVGRTWCQDGVYDPCEDCGAQPVKYVLAPKRRRRATRAGSRAGSLNARQTQ